MTVLVNNIINEINRLTDFQVYGRVTSVVGLVVEIGGVQGAISIGDHCRIVTRDGRKVLCEVVGFRQERALVMPFGPLDGIGLGCRAEVSDNLPVIYPDASWLGRVINAFGEPVDGRGLLPTGHETYPIRCSPPPANSRARVRGKIDLGVRSMNAFLTVCRGQRMGIFSGSGIGKSTMLSMMARHTDAEVSVIGLIGERGREAREFIEDDLGEEGLKRSVVVVATSDEPPLVRRQAAYVTMAVSEYFRDRGAAVLTLMDSVTRFAMAQREISLSTGEPPASKGYTPSVFAELPQLLERAGPGSEDSGGSITGLFTVLVEGDDHNEPVADAVRGILDGHVVLDRTIAERGRFPAVNVLRSVSRTMPDCNTDTENAIVNRARQLIATYEDMAELIRLGAYRKGTDPSVDEAIHYFPALEDFMRQTKPEKTGLLECYQILARILDMEAPPGDAGVAPSPRQAAAVSVPPIVPTPPPLPPPPPAAPPPTPPTPAAPGSDGAVPSHLAAGPDVGLNAGGEEAPSPPRPPAMAGFGPTLAPGVSEILQEEGEER